MKYITITAGNIDDNISKPMDYEEAKAIFNRVRKEALEDGYGDIYTDEEDIFEIADSEYYQYVAVRPYEEFEDERLNIIRDIRLHSDMANVRSTQYMWTLEDNCTAYELDKIDNLVNRLEQIIRG